MTVSVPATARLQTRNGTDVLLEGVSVAGAVDGLILEVSVEQRFRNPSDSNIEIVYTFPLPGGAVLLGVDVRLGERQLTGAVAEKRQAAQAYEASLAAGDAAIMLEKNHDHSYSLNLGNLAAGEACVVTMRYAETLQFEQRGLRISVPTVIAPRYGDPVRDAHLAPHQVAGHSLSAHYPFSLTLRLSRELAHARIGSPSHAVATQLAGDGSVTVSLAQPAALDRDFVLVLDQLPHESLAIATPDTYAPGHVAVLASFCPRFAAATPQAVAARLLVDCSGSMAGDSIAAARRALHAIVAQFVSGDRFSLSRFGTTVHHRARGLWQTSARTRSAASRWVDALHANLGGTEMEDALTSTFATGDEGASDVLLVTDGQIEAIDGVIAAATASGHRLFIVAIGSSPAESHLRRLALATGGACDFVAAGERVEPAVLRMFARLRSPRLQQLRVSWPAQPAWASEMPEAVFDGDTVNLFAQFAGAVHGEVRLYGRDGDAPEREIACAVLAASAQGETLARMAASARITAPGDFAAALRIAIEYQLVTQRTNFLLVHERAEHAKANDMPALRHIAPMVPAGWAGTGSTATSPVMAVHAPAMWRRSTPSDVMTVADCDARWDIPAFLRKEDVLSADDDWSHTDSYGGMTPSGLHKLLRTLPRAQWPATYAELRRKGLGVALVDWLDLSVGSAGDERSVIAAFLFVMSLDETRSAMRDASDRAPSFGKTALKLIGRLLPRRAADNDEVDLALAERIAANLAGMTTTSWPPCVFALAPFDHATLPAAEAACA